MGLLRFTLAAMVVIFHLGGIHMLSGRLAVMGFYIVSGFLIARVLDTRYAGSLGGLGAFAINRLLRLYPTFLVLFALSAIFVSFVSEVHVAPDETDVLRLPVEWRWDNLLLLPKVQGAHLLGPSAIVPQSWSINVELCFYAVAVVMALLSLRWCMLVALPVAAIVFATRVLSAESFQIYDNLIYKDAVSTFVFFALGACLHFAPARFRLPVKAFPWILGAFLFFTYAVLGNRYLIIMLDQSSQGWAVALLSVNVAFAVLLVAVIQSAPEDTAAARWLGDLSYPIYLNHMLVYWVMLWGSEQSGLPWFGRPNDPGFALWGLAFSVGLAFGLERFIERPVSIVRAMVRNWPTRAAAQSLPA